MIKKGKKIPYGISVTGYGVYLPYHFWIPHLL